MATITTVLFDLDGTLLPMDQDRFVGAYFKLLAKKLAPLGYDPQKLVEGIWGGTSAMVANDGSKPNEEAFWQYFCSRFGEQAREDEPTFATFYKEEFRQVQQVCGFRKEAKQVIDLLRGKGLRIILATNPIFPRNCHREPNPLGRIGNHRFCPLYHL